MFCKFDHLLLTFLCETASNRNYDSAAWRMESEGLRLNGIGSLSKDRLSSRISELFLHRFFSISYCDPTLCLCVYVAYIVIYM